MIDTINPRSEPTTISLDLFRQSLVGGWINFFEKDPKIADWVFPPNNKPLSVGTQFTPDREEDFAIPSIIIHRLNESFEASRTGNYFSSIKQEKDGCPVETSIYAYRLSGMYQFDVLSRDLASQFKLTGYVDQKLMGGEAFDDEGNRREGVRKPTIKFFRLKDLSKRTSLQQPVSELPDTDVCVYWRPYTGVKTTETKTFTTEFEQLSYTVEFWCDVWYTEHDEIITSIIVNESRFSFDG